MMTRRPLRAKGSRISIFALITLLAVAGFSQLGVPGAQSSNTSALSPYLAGKMVMYMFSPNGLVINEIYESQTPTNEYFELYNTSSISIDLSTYVIYNRDGSTPLSGLSNPVIAPGQFRAIGPAQLGTPTIGGPSGLDRTDFLGLVNTSPTDTVIDVVNFGGSPNPGWPNYERFASFFFLSNIPQLPPSDGTRSLQRWPDGLDSDQGSDFAQILSSPSSPSCGDPFEDDNTFATAREQSVNSSALHRICAAGDQDWIAVVMSANNNYQLFAQAQGSQIDITLRVYDSTGVQVAEHNDPASRNASITYRPSTSGTYRAQIVDSAGGGGSGQGYLYSLTITAEAVPSATPTRTISPTPSTTTPTPIPCLDVYEPDNSLHTARPIALNTDQRHSLCPAGDQDWITFVATPDKVYTMQTTNLTASVDTIITLFDSQGRGLAENDDFQPGQGLQSRIDYVFTQTGVYYLRIRDARGSGGLGYEYTVSVSSVGSLPPTGTPTASPTINPNSPTPTLGPCVDSYESDGVPADAKSILIGTVQKHSICPEGDADWVRFYARAGKVYTIRTANLGPGLDTYMYVFDTDGARILAQNDDGGDGVASRIDFFPLRDDWYFLQVKNAGDIGGREQTYDLSLVVVPGVPQPPNAPTPIIAPPITVTTGAQVTQPAQPTRPPVSSPTRAPQPPTPAGGQPPPPVQTGGALPPQQPPPPVQTGQPVPPAPPPPAPPTQDPGPTAAVPNVPRTGAKDGAASRPLDLPVASPNSSLYSFRVFYDADSDNRWKGDEGIRGVSAHYMELSGTKYAEITSSEAGIAEARLPSGFYRLFVPYFGVTLGAGGNDALRLPPVTLPERVP